MIDVDTVNAISTIMLLMAIEGMYPGKRLIHLFLDNAATITPSWCRHGWRGQGPGSSFTSSRPTARIWMRSSGYGG